MVDTEVNSEPGPPVPGVEVVRVPGKGRGMRATKAFEPGDLIIDEEPFGAVVMTDMLEGEPVCHSEFMMVDDKDLKTCVACKRVRYSSKAAQKVDWTRGHKYECKALRSPHVRPLSMLRLMARVLWKRGAMMKAQKDSNPGPDAPAAAGKANLDESMHSCSSGCNGRSEASAVGYWESFEAVAVLQANPGVLGSMPRPALLQMLASLRFYLSQAKAAHNSEEAMHEKLLLQLMSNCFAIHEAGNGLSLGLGLFPIGSVLNHSSRPNCGQGFFKGRLQIRALRSIRPGDDLEISYTTPDEPTFLQRKDLQTSYCFDLRPDLPSDLRFKGSHSLELGGCMRALVLDEAASEKLPLDGIDAAHCAVLSDPAAVAESRASSPAEGLAPEASRFCSVKVKSDSDFADFGPGPFAIPGADDLESNITLVAAQQILREAWLPDEAGAAWLDQVRKDRWRVDVIVFGKWPAAGEAAWQAAAYAATFAVAAQAWSDSLRARAETGVARRLLLKADAAGRAAGLADSHLAMRPVLRTLVDIFLHQPIRTKLPGMPASEDEKHNFAVAKRFEHAVRAIHPEGTGELGFDLDKVAEAAGRCADAGVAYAARLWVEAAARLRVAFGEERNVMRIVFKAHYFKDENMLRRAELIQRFGPYLPPDFMRALS